MNAKDRTGGSCSLTKLSPIEWGRQRGALGMVFGATATLAVPAAYGSTMYVSGGPNPGQSVISTVSATGVVTPFATLPTNSDPAGLVFGLNGDLYVADDGTSEISQISPTGTVSATPFATFTSGTSLRGMAVDSSGNLYVAAINGGGTIQEISPTGTVTPFATVGSSPTGLAFDSNGNLYVADVAANTIDKITPGGVVTPFATLPTSPGFSNPEGLAFDASGNLYAADGGSNKISEISPNGLTVTPFASLPGGSEPEGLAFDTSGNLYVGNSGEANITEISPTGTVMTPPFATDINVTYLTFAPVPEPSSVVLLNIVVGSQLLGRRRNRA